MRRQLSTNGNELLLSANVGSFTNPQATCCGSGEVVTTPGSANQADARIRLLTVTEQGAVIGSRPLVAALSQNVINTGYAAGTQPSYATMTQGRGLVAAVPNGNNIRFWYGPNVPDAGFLSTDVNLALDFTLRTDAMVVPLSDTRAGLIWSDGDLKRTVMRCGP